MPNGGGDGYPSMIANDDRVFIFLRDSDDITACHFGWNIDHGGTVPHSDTCGAATHSLIIGAGGR